jgi:hypothetical protein
MRTGSASLNPSRFEGWSTVVEEIKALGVPMILSDLRMHRERAGETARYFAPDDCPRARATPEGSAGGVSCATAETASREWLSAGRYRLIIVF